MRNPNHATDLYLSQKDFEMINSGREDARDFILPR